MVLLPFFHFKLYFYCLFLFRPECFLNIYHLFPASSAACAMCSIPCLCCSLQDISSRSLYPWHAILFQERPFLFPTHCFSSCRIFQDTCIPHWYLRYTRHPFVTSYFRACVGIYVRTDYITYMRVERCHHTRSTICRTNPHLFTFRASLSSLQAVLSTYTAVGIFEGGFRVSDFVGHLRLRDIES